MLVKMKRALVIINGYPVPKQFLNYFWQKNDIHICTDGSFHSVFKAGKFCYRDIDSLKKEKLKYGFLFLLLLFFLLILIL